MFKFHNPDIIPNLGGKPMNCPYCNKEMEKGVIHGDRYAIKWIPDENDKGPLFRWLPKGIILSRWGGTTEDVYHCEYCKKLMIDTSDMEDTRQKNK